MFKTIKARTIIIQLIIMAVILGIVFGLFVLFFKPFYFNRKLDVIEDAYNYLETADIEELRYDDKRLVSYRDQGIKIIVADSEYRDVLKLESDEEKTEDGKNYESRQKQPYPVVVDARINRYIVDRADKFENRLVLKNKKYKIYGYGIITQKENDYYVYIYENKHKLSIAFSYSWIFLLSACILAIIAGILVSVWSSNRISRPIKQVEKTAKEAADGNLDIRVDDNYVFSELNDLATSINIMITKIGGQVQTLEDEVSNKTEEEKKRRYFINNVSHEMKTPLAIISSQAEMISLVKDDKQRMEYCESIMEEAEQMSNMLNDMLVVYSAQSEDAFMDLREIDIGELIRGECGKYADLFERRGLELSVECEKDCVAKANPDYFFQAVDNYITNAIKHSIKGGKVCVRVKKRGCVRVEVENQGEGIPDGDSEKIWNMFFKGEETGELKGQKSSGLGLYLVKSIVQLHGGRYGFKNIDGGIVFWIELPLA